MNRILNLGPKSRSYHREVGTSMQRGGVEVAMSFVVHFCQGHSTYAIDESLLRRLLLDIRHRSELKSHSQVRLTARIYQV